MAKEFDKKIATERKAYFYLSSIVCKMHTHQKKKTQQNRMKGKEAPLVSQKWMFHDPSKGRPFLRILAQQQGHQVPRISIRYLRKRKGGDG